MKPSKILLGTAIVGAVVGLGLLTNYVYGGQPTEENTKLKPNPNPPIPPKQAKHVPPSKPKSTNRKVAHPPEKTTPSNPRRTTSERRHPESTRSAATGDQFPLRLGSSGFRVERLQVWLMRNHGWTGTITGVFDQATEDKLFRFLKVRELDQHTYEQKNMGKPVYEQNQKH